MLEVRNLAFDYAGEKILRDVSFVVSPGEIVSVIGANGAGKTTLLKILATLVVPAGGKVLEDGIDAFQRPLRYRRQLGYLPENPQPYADMTVKEYLNFRAALKGEPGKRIRRRVGESAELCLITDILRTRIGRLSAGLKKRVALADALLLRPRVLLLDDFLAGLDHSMRETSAQILSNAAAFSSVIITGHELADLARWTTRFLVLKDGIISSTVETAGVDQAVLKERILAGLQGGAS